MLLMFNDKISQDEKEIKNSTDSIVNEDALNDQIIYFLFENF